MIVVPPVCIHCAHYGRSAPVACTAFPERIPDAIWLERNPHTAPVDGDHGIRFAAQTGATRPDHRK